MERFSGLAALTLTMTGSTNVMPVLVKLQDPGKLKVESLPEHIKVGRVD